MRLLLVSGVADLESTEPPGSPQEKLPAEALKYLALRPVNHHSESRKPRNRSPTMTPRQIICTFPTRALIVALAAAATTGLASAQIYNSQGGGTALDANQARGGTGINSQVPSNQINTTLNNDIVTGNVTGGKALRVDVGYRAPGALLIDLPSDALFNANALSGPGGANTTSYYNSYTSPTARFSPGGITSQTAPFYSGNTYIQPSAAAGSSRISYSAVLDRGAVNGLASNRPLAFGNNNFNTTTAANELRNSGVSDSNPLAARAFQRTMTQVEDGNPYVSKYLKPGQAIEAHNAYDNMIHGVTRNPEFADLRLSTLSLGASINQYRRLNLQDDPATDPKTAGPQQGIGNTSFGTDPNTPGSNQGNTPGQHPNDLGAPGSNPGQQPGTANPQTPETPTDTSARLRKMILGETDPKALESVEGDTAYRDLLNQVLNPGQATNSTQNDQPKIGEWRSPSEDRLKQANDRLNASRDRAGTTGTSRNALSEQNPRLAELMDQLDYNLPAMRSLAGQTESKASELLKEAEAQMAEGQYFDAERTYQRVLTLKPSDPLVHVGRVHALLGAGMIRSSALQIRRLFEAHPELIAARYEEPLLPNNEQLIRVQEDLTTLADTQDAANAAGVMLAYIGYQKDSKTLMRYGLAVAETASPNDSLVPVLRQIWLEDASPKPLKP